MHATLARIHFRWRLKGGVIGTELRAFNNMGWNRDAGGTTTEKIGLTG